MATQIKHRRGNNAEIMSGTPAVGELWFNTDDNTIHMGDGATAGGIKHAKLASVTLYSRTVVSCQARTDLKVQFLIFVAEPDSGSGAFWEVVTGETPNGDDILSLDNYPSLQIKRVDNTRIDERVNNLYSNRVLHSQTEISALDDSTISTVATSKEGKQFDISSTINGLENTPDTIKMADDRFANRVGGFKTQRLGVFTTPDSLGHRCGDLSYVKYSQTHAELITDLSRYIPYTLEDVGDPNITVAYCDYRKGNDNAGDGLSWANAKGGLASAWALDTDILLVRGGGVYNRVNRLDSQSVTKNRSMIAVGGDAYMGVMASGTWTKTGGQNDVYQLDYLAGLTNVTNYVFDTKQLNAQGAPTLLVSVGSIATCNSTPGSFYHTGTITYVHAVDSRNVLLDSLSIICTQPVVNTTFTFTGDFNLYWEGIQSWGGLDSAVVQCISDGSVHEGSSFYTKNCVLGGAAGGNFGNGLYINDIGISISENTQCLANRRDGFNYHNYLEGVGGVPGLNPHFVEINCQAHGNGVNGSEGNNQGSTAHEAVIGFRINSDYSGHADGGCVVDIDGVKVFNVAIIAKNSSTVGLLLSADGYPAGVNDAVWWVDGAHCSGNPVISDAHGDIAIDGFYTQLHMQDTDTEKPLSTRTFSNLPDEDFS